MKAYDMTKYRRRAKRYQQGMQAVKPESSSTEMPIEVWDNTFMRPPDVKSIEEIELPERIRDFAVRTVLEGYKPDRVWAELCGVSMATIGNWRRRDDVAKLRAFMLYERRAYSMARMIRLEHRLFDRIDELLSMRITGDTAPVALQTVKFVAAMLRGESGDTDPKTLAMFNVNVGMGPNGGQTKIGSPFRKERDVTPEELNHLASEAERHRDYIEQFKAMKANNGDSE